MCFAPIDRTQEPDPTRSEPEAPGGHAGSASAGRTTTATGPTAKTAVWPCPVCDGRNPIELDACATCGTPFAALMRQERRRSDVDRRDAFRRSLLFPGLGHRMAGRELDGFARGALFTMLAMATLLLGISGVASGAVRTLFLLYASATVAVWLMSAVEAARLAEGRDLFVPSRALLWITVTILLVSVVLVSFVIGIATS